MPSESRRRRRHGLPSAPVHKPSTASSEFPPARHRSTLTRKSSSSHKLVSAMTSPCPWTPTQPDVVQENIQPPVPHARQHSRGLSNLTRVPSNFAATARVIEVPEPVLTFPG